MAVPADAPTILSLDLFSSVVQLGSLSAAAAAHGIAQPSASTRIRQLERQLGVELLTRGPNGSVPTEAGAVVAGWSQNVLDALDDLLNATAALRSTETNLCIAASYTIAEHLLPRWLGRLRSSHPDAHIELEVVNSAAVIDRVRTGQAALGFVEAPGTTAGLRSQVVERDELEVVVAPGHPWARRRRPVDPVLLADTALVLRERGSGTRDALVAAMALCGLDLADPALELGSTTAVRAAAEGGAAPAVLSHLAVADSCDAGRLVAVAVEGLDLTRELRAVWLPGRPLEPAAKALVGRP